MLIGKLLCMLFGYLTVSLKPLLGVTFTFFGSFFNDFVIAVQSVVDLYILSLLCEAIL